MKPETKNKITKYFAPTLLFLAALALSAGMWRPLLLYGHSSTIDGWRLLVFDAAVRAGDFYPRWVSDYYYGFGSPIFHFYAPLPFFLSEIWHLVGFSIVGAMKLTLVLTWALSGVFMYLLARDYLSRYASFVAGLFYLMAPYHLVDMLVRHALGEHVAFAWMPLALWGAAGCVRTPGLIRFAAGAAGLALLTLTHNITAMIFMPFLIGWIIFEYFRRRSFWGLAAGAGSVAFGLLLSAFFWLPAFVDKKLVWATESLTEEFFRYEDHFIHFKQLFAPYWGFGGSRVGVAEDFFSQQVGLAHWFWIALALLAFAWRFSTRDDVAQSKNRLFGSIAAFVVFLAALFMTTSSSKFIWDAVPLLSFVQFPWRFLAIACLGSSLWAASAIDWIEIKGDGRRKLKPAIVAIICVLTAYASYMSPRFAVYGLEGGEIFMGSYDQQIELLNSSPSIVRYASTLNRGFVVRQGKTGVSRDDYLPRTVGQKPERPAKNPFSVHNGILQNAVSAGANAYVAKVNMDALGSVYLNQFYFPGWLAKVDGIPVAAKAEEIFGRVEVEVSPGRHIVSVSFESTPLTTVANTLSLAALIFLTGMMVYIIKGNRC
jgi:6-pyruvoyl-tetrahydropterin synthase related domain